MATTTSADLIVPEVWGDATLVTVLGKTVMLPLVDTDDTLVGVPGDTVHFPKYAYIGDADDLTEGVPMTPVKLAMVDSLATIKEAGKAIELTDRALLTAMGNPNDKARTNLGLSIARKLDTDIRSEAERSYSETIDGVTRNYAPLSATVDGPFSWSAYTRGIALLGDEYGPPDIAGLVLHSAQHISLLNDPKFQSADTFGADAVLTRGQVGRLGNVPVYVSDRATSIADAGSASGNQPGHRALIIKRGALELKYKRRPVVETDRDILARTNVITTNVHYGVKRVDDRGVIVLSTTDA